jgi:hypothetical protein
MRPHLRNIEAIPYDDMREDDILWMQKLITWEELDEVFRFDKEWNLIK